MKKSLLLLRIIKKNIIGIIVFSALFLLTLFTPYFDNINEINPIVTSISCILFVIIYIIIFVIVNTLHNKKLQSITDKTYKSFNTYLANLNNLNYDLPKGRNICLKSGYLCSAQKIIESEYYSRIISKLELTEDECKYYNLIKDTDFDDKELHFFDDHPSGEIWVVSNALETEIKTEEELEMCPDESLKNSMQVVKENIKRGGKYTQFVSLGPQGTNDVTFVNRCKIYWSALPHLDENQKRIAMPIIRIDDVFSNHEDGRQRVYDPDFEYLVKLTSTVLFVDDSSNQLFVEGYFCLRPDDRKEAMEHERKTVFFKMPICMRDDYYYFLLSKKEEYYKNFEKGVS